MRKVGWLRAVAVAAIGLAICCAAPGTKADGGRKIITSSKPQYTDLARKMRLSGTVKLEVVITAGGQVKEAKALGGHPVLVEAAEQAVKDWKFEPGSSPTTEVLEFKFDLQQ